MPRPKTLLLMGHPGHELRVLQWLREAQPQVCILTDGSTLTAPSRIHQSLKILHDFGSTTGPLLGKATDQTFYAEILAGNTDFFLQQAETLFQCLATEHHDVVAGDAAEGYTPTHDLCRGIIDAVVHKYEKGYHRKLQNLAFPLINSPRTAPPGLSDLGETLELSEENFAEKFQRAKDYAAVESELALTLQYHGLDSFKSERLWHQKPWLGFDAPVMDPPFYEVRGKQHVDLGLYQQMIRFELHLKPILQKLRAWAES